MYCIGIDIGSTASKVCVMENDTICHTLALPTGWSSVKTAEQIKRSLQQLNYISESTKIVATGYGRISVPYADKTMTEITCHGKGAAYLFKDNCTVIDIGGQDTKVVTIEKGKVTNFTMNDKCAAGTGRFLELMANTLGLDIEKMCEIAEKGRGISITSMCTVFAESEVISLIGRGEKREDIAYGVIESITGKVKALCQKHGDGNKYFITGGLSDNKYIVKRLSEKLGEPVMSSKLGRFAGAIGASIAAEGI
ncbi:MAG: hgdC 2 [Clostridiaceae bacterium]|jgi:predicted CoA-substrate-specific enzyme activase|nr:hgdC 2 [Clostridiaceae bacterium]